jgi:hypothetical protein
VEVDGNVYTLLNEYTEDNSDPENYIYEENYSLITKFKVLVVSYSLMSVNAMKIKLSNVWTAVKNINTVVQICI